MANILDRIGVEDRLENAQKVCKTRHKICKDPSMWRVINMQFNIHQKAMIKMCMLAVDRSQGQLVDVSIGNYGSDDFLISSQLKRLQFSDNYFLMCHALPVALKKLPLLEELSLYSPYLLKKAIKVATLYCPMLKTLKVNVGILTVWVTPHNEVAIAIGENLPELRHLELINSYISNVGLNAILDGCRHLESLDLRLCSNIHFTDELWKKLSKIKYLRLPMDTLDRLHDYEYDPFFFMTYPEFIHSERNVYV